MATLSHSGSAKIVQFPKRGRFATERRDAAKPLDRAGASFAPVVDWEGGWYHQAAIDEATRPRRR